MALEENLKNLKNLDRDDLLSALGLQLRRSAGENLLPALSLFGAGFAAGIGVGMLLAPKSGRQLRRSLGRQVEKARDAIEDVAARN